MEKNFPYNKKSGKIVFVAFPDSFLCPSLFPAPAALFFKNRRQSFKPLLRPIAERAPPLEGDWRLPFKLPKSIGEDDLFYFAVGEVHVL